MDLPSLLLFIFHQLFAAESVQLRNAGGNGSPDALQINAAIIMYNHIAQPFNLGPWHLRLCSGPIFFCERSN